MAEGEDGTGGTASARRLQRHEIAMRYLHRNARFQNDYAEALLAVAAGTATRDTTTLALVERWGLSYVADPAAPRDMARIIVRADLLPGMLTLAPSEPCIPPAPALKSMQLGPVREALHIKEGHILLLADPAGDHQLCIAEPDHGPHCLCLTLDEHLHLRLAAAERLRRRLSGLKTGPPPLPLTLLQQRRLLIMLRAWDGRLSGAKARDLAALLIDPKVAGYSAAEWSDSRQRRLVSRWIKAARLLIECDYRRLLLP